MSLDARRRSLRRRIRRRVQRREDLRKQHRGAAAQREARAVRRLRARLHKVEAWLSAPKTQYDSVNSRNVPRDAKGVAYYVDGVFENEWEVRHRCPDARYTSIAVFALHLADSLDIEPGNASIDQAPGWYRRFKDRWPHRIPIFYVDCRSALALERELSRRGITRNQYILWTAHYAVRGRHICGPRTCNEPGGPGVSADATQYTTSGERLDISVCRPSFWIRERG